jgi:hypothetical protein
MPASGGLYALTTALVLPVSHPFPPFGRRASSAACTHFSPAIRTAALRHRGHNHNVRAADLPRRRFNDIDGSVVPAVQSTQKTAPMGRLPRTQASFPKSGIVSVNRHELLQHGATPNRCIACSRRRNG